MPRVRGLSVREAAAIMGKSDQFVRVGLQTKALPFGTAVKLSTQWTYYISPAKFYEYVDGRYCTTDENSPNTENDQHT